MMQIVINIDENLYTRLFDNGVDNYDDAVDMATAIRKGVPLPEGHGRLIDEDQIPGDGGWDFSDRLMSTPTIIEADTAESEDEHFMPIQSLTCDDITDIIDES